MFVVIELQKTGNEVASIVTKHNTRNEADSKFYAVMSAAAVSNVEKHACTLLTEEGTALRNAYYEHEQEEE